MYIFWSQNAAMLQICLFMLDLVELLFAILK